MVQKSIAKVARWAKTSPSPSPSSSSSSSDGLNISWGSLNQSLKSYGFICNTIFFTCTHAHKSLSNKTLLLKVAELEMCTWGLGHGRVFVIHCWLDVWTEPGKWFFSQYCIHLLRKIMRTDLLLCDGKLQLKHAPSFGLSYIAVTFIKINNLEH